MGGVVSGGRRGTPADVVRRRRRRNVVAVVVTAFVLGGIAVLIAVLSSTERVNRMWSEAELSTDGGARIIEVIDYDFGYNQRHGIFRDVPGLSIEAKVNVTMDGKPVPYDVQPYMGDDDETRVLIGDAHHEITGAHR